MLNLTYKYIDLEYISFPNTPVKILTIYNICTWKNVWALLYK